MTSTPRLGASALTSSRYGDTSGRRRRNLWLLAGFGAFVAAVMILWAVWVGLGGTASDLDAQVAGQTVDGSHLAVTLTVHAKPGSDVSCAVEAQNLGFDVVGYDVLNLGTVTKATTVVTHTLVTYEPAVSGSLDKCWLN